MKILVSVLFTVLGLSVSNLASAAVCDVNDDGFVDASDVQLISAARGQAADPGDPRDANANGLVDVGDARACALQCNLPRCAPQPDPEPVNVPDVIGLTQAAAEAAITGAGLSVGSVTTQPSDSVPAGNVIAQNPGGGASVTPGSSVDITVSTGPENVTVPDVVGLTQATAEAAITGAGLSVGSVTTQPSDSVPAGNVIAQNPAGGASVTPGSSVDITVSTGPEDVTVPDVVGLTQATAEAAITGAGLSVGSVTTQPSDSVPAGNVITQNPAGGASVTPGSSVDITVSTGPENVTVPDVVGLTQATAEAAIVGTGLSVGAINTDNSDTVPAGSVISQNPGGGASVAPGSAVDLVVSLGPALVNVPDVVGLTQETAAEAIEEGAGLLIGLVTFENSDNVPDGDVISQNPDAGTPVAPGSSVDLVVSLGVAVPVVDSVRADVDPEFIAIGATAEVTCEALDADGNVITPADFDISTTSPAAISNGQFSSTVDGEFEVTCALVDTAFSATTDAVVLPDDVDPSFGDFQDNAETLAELSNAVDVANDLEDVPGLLNLRSQIQAEIAQIDTTVLAANLPLPNDTDRPTDQQLIDELGDAPNPAIDDPWKDAVSAYRQNVIDYRAKLASITPQTVTSADVAELQALTDALNALAASAAGLEPSHTAVLAMNDEINELYTDLVPNETIENSQATVAIIDTVDPALMAFQQWQPQLDTPEALYAGIEISGLTSEAFHAAEAEAFSFVSVLTSQAIAGTLRKIANQFYKQILNSWKRTAKAIRNLAPPMGIDPPMLFSVLPTAFPANSPFQAVLDGNNFVAGNTTVSIDVIVSGFVANTVTAPVSTSGGADPFAVADVPALGVFCNILSACAARVKVITPGGTSNEVAVNVF